MGLTTVNHCRNCEHPVDDLFCGHCGQRLDAGRIDASYVLAEFVHFITNIRHRFIFTSLQLLSSPGRVTDEFIEGKRKKYQSPVSYFLLWTTIYILFLSYIDLVAVRNQIIDYSDYFGPGDTTPYAIGHLGFVLAAVIPFQALYLFALVTWKRFSFFETMAATMYLLGTIVLLQLVFAVLVWLVHFAGVGAINLAISDILKVLYLGWFAADLSKRFPLKLKALRVTLFVGLAIGTFTLWRLYGVPMLVQIIHLGTQ